MFTDVGFSFTLEPENLPKAMSASNSQHLPQPAGIAGEVTTADGPKFGDGRASETCRYKAIRPSKRQHIDKYTFLIDFRGLNRQTRPATFALSFRTSAYGLALAA